jgi:cell division protein FtsA
VLLRAAYGPREAVSARKLMSRQITAADAPRVHRGNLVARAAGWLKDNL